MISFILLSLETEEKRTKFEKLYYEYNKKMMNIAYGITKDQYDAEDAMNSALFIVAENIDKINTDNPAMVKSYLYKIVKNTAINIVRKKVKEPTILDIDSVVYLDADEFVDKIIENEKYNALVKTIAGIPSASRDVLILHYVHNMSSKEIAFALNRKLSTVKSQLARGNKLLKNILIEEEIKWPTLKFL